MNSKIRHLQDVDLAPRASSRLIEFSPLAPYDDLVSNLEERLGSQSPLIVVLDFAERLWLYRKDQHSLVRAMQSAWPEREISFRIFSHGPQGGWTDWEEEQREGSHPEPQAWVRPNSPETQVLIVSDLGWLSGNQRIIDAWKDFVRNFFPDLDRDEEWGVAILTPDGHGLGGFVKKENVLPWSEKTQTPVYCSGTRLGIEDLLAMAAVLRRIDPPLLREMRRILPINGADDPGLEAAFWVCSHVQAGSAASIVESQREVHLRRFRQLSSATQLDLFQLFMLHHAHLSVALCYEEVLSFGVHARQEVLADSEVSRVIQDATAWLNRLFATLRGRREINRQCRAIVQGMVARTDSVMRERYFSGFNLQEYEKTLSVKEIVLDYLASYSPMRMPEIRPCDVGFGGSDYTYAVEQGRRQQGMADAAYSRELARLKHLKEDVEGCESDQAVVETLDRFIQEGGNSGLAYLLEMVRNQKLPPLI